ncbi:YkgJ family cysteine cluster protein [Enterocloster bolteae]|uniref:YkgJ family cysteine cluster protein n=1 Tax=Enterocloster bolteae TaxID=208479 RepID=UPI003AF1CE6D
MECMSALSVIAKGMEDNLYNYTVNGKCSKCGNCCSDILPLSDDEIRRIHKYVCQKRIKESKHLIPVAKPVLDMTCPFRDNGKKICTIYEVRPEICRQFICDSEQRAKANRERLKKGRRVFSMREVFFGAD